MTFTSNKYMFFKVKKSTFCEIKFVINKMKKAKRA